MAKKKRGSQHAVKADRAPRPLIEVRTLVLIGISACAGFWAAGSAKVSTGLTVAIAVFVVLLNITG